MGKEQQRIRDGTGPYKDSWQRENKKVGRRIEAGETCPEEFTEENKIDKIKFWR